MSLSPYLSSMINNTLKINYLKESCSRYKKGLIRSV